MRTTKYFPAVQAGRTTTAVVVDLVCDLLHPSTPSPLHLSTSPPFYRSLSSVQLIIDKPEDCTRLFIEAYVNAGVFKAKAQHDRVTKRGTRREEACFLDTSILTSRHTPLIPAPLVMSTLPRSRQWPQGLISARPYANLHTLLCGHITAGPKIPPKDCFKEGQTVGGLVILARSSHYFRVERTWWTAEMPLMVVSSGRAVLHPPGLTFTMASWPVSFISQLSRVVVVSGDVARDIGRRMPQRGMSARNGDRGGGGFNVHLSVLFISSSLDGRVMYVLHAFLLCCSHSFGIIFLRAWLLCVVYTARDRPRRWRQEKDAKQQYSGSRVFLQPSIDEYPLFFRGRLFRCRQKTVIFQTTSYFLDSIELR